MTVRGRRAIQTPRLRLRPSAPADAELLRSHWDHPDVRRFLFDDQRVTAGTVAGLLARSDADFERAGFGVWVVQDLTVAAPFEGFVGTCGLADVEGEDLVAILYSVQPERWGGGLATEAAAGVVRYAFQTLGLDLVVGRVDDGNEASRRVLERVGMRPFRTITVGGRIVPFYAVAATAGEPKMTRM